MSKKYPAIPEPTLTPESTRDAVLAMKQTLEIMTGQTKPRTASAVTWQDLVDLGLIVPSQVPPK